MKRIPFVFLLLVHFACKKNTPCDDGHCTPSELSWLVYSPGATINFSNGTTNQTLTVEPRNSIMNLNPSHDDCPQYWETVTMGIDNGTVHLFTLTVSHNRSNNGVYYAYLDGSSLPSLPVINNITINHVNYNNVLELTTDTMHPQNANPIIWRIYYSKQVGILQYDYTLGAGSFVKN